MAFSATCRRQPSHRQSEYCVRNSARAVASSGRVVHQHPASCWQLNGSAHREHFFSTVAGSDGFRNPPVSLVPDVAAVDERLTVALRSQRLRVHRRARPAGDAPGTLSFHLLVEHVNIEFDLLPTQSRGMTTLET